MTRSLCSRSIKLLQSITPAKWYYELKAALLASAHTGQPLDHPLNGRVHASLEEVRAVSTMAGRRAKRITLHLVLPFAAIMFCTQAVPLWSADSRRFATVPALGVLAGGQTGIIHYIVLQIDKDPRREGPTVQFNEINLGGGSLVSEDWKEGVRQAVAAATKAVGEDGREWVSQSRTGHTMR